MKKMIKKLMFASFFFFFIAENVFATDPLKVVVMPYLESEIVPHGIFLRLEEKGNIIKQIVKKLKNDSNIGDFIFFDAEDFQNSSYDSPDFYVKIGNSNDPKLAKITIEATPTTRVAVSLINIQGKNDQEFTYLITNEILKILKYTPDMLKVNADKLINVNNSVVQYRIKSLSGEDIMLNVDYDQKHEIIQQVNIFLENERENGEYNLELLTKEGPKIKVKATYVNSATKNILIDTDYRPEDFNKVSSSLLTVLSKAGYEVVFRFDWGRNGEIRNVSISPKENPFSSIKIE